MIKKIFKWLLKSVGALVALLLIAYLVIYFKTEARANRRYDVKLQTLKIPVDSVAYLAGKHIAETRGCTGCHGANLAGGAAFFDEKTPIGMLYAANITSGKGGINYSDEDWIRALRHGLNRDCKTVWFMPSHEVCHISNQQLAQLISFLKKQPPVNKITPPKSLKPLGRMLVFLNKLPMFPAEIIDHNAVYKDTVQAAVTAEYGAYLTTTCQGCHGPQLKGNPPHGEHEPPIPNISATGEPGKWTADEFIVALRTGKTPGGKQLSEAMPYKELTYTNDEMKSIFLYLQQLK